MAKIGRLPAEASKRKNNYTPSSVATPFFFREDENDVDGCLH